MTSTMANRVLLAVGLAIALAAGALARARAVASEAAKGGQVLATGPVEWVRAGMNENRPTWGIRGGLTWGLPAESGPSDGPRGLIRLRYPVLSDNRVDLINFIAVEPVVRGRRGFSELERSRLDGVPGKRLWAMDPGSPAEGAARLPAGKLARSGSGVEVLTLQVGVERFENGAQVRLSVVQRSSASDEIELTVRTEPDSAPVDYCILTATMGNKARTRQLWLKNEVADSRVLYPDYRAPEFAPHRVFPLERLLRTPAGDVLAAITTDEADPAKVDPYPSHPHWRYGGFPVTQYWKKPAGTANNDLHVAVNGRYTYWLSRQPIPGGVAFENFEMRERFREGQVFVFGITRKTPGDLGFKTRSEGTSDRVGGNLRRPAQPKE